MTSSSDRQYIVANAVGGVTYYGSAEMGRAVTEAFWSIKRVTTSGNTSTTEWAVADSGPSNSDKFIWNDYATYNYSLNPDATAPTLPTVTIASNNLTTTLAKPGDVITLTIVASEAINKPTVTIASHAITSSAVVKGVDPLHWTATYTVVSGDTNGIVTFSIAFTDLSNNAGITVSAKTGGSDVTLDKTLPTLVSATKTDVMHLNVVLSELAIVGTITKANDGGFTVAKQVTGTTYAVSALTPGVDNTHVVLTVADVSGAITEGLKITYTAGGNGTVADLASNLMSTDGTGVVIAGW